jgi:hypothetical protein
MTDRVASDPRLEGAALWTASSIGIKQAAPLQALGLITYSIEDKNDT